MDKCQGEDSNYEFKMKQVLADLKAKPSVRAGKDWDLTDRKSWLEWDEDY